MSERCVIGNANAYVEGHHKARYHWAVDRLKNCSGLVVDIACGTGYGTRLLAENKNCTVVGLDRSQDAVAAASAESSLSNLSFAVANAEDLRDLNSGSATAIVSFETIEHLERPLNFLSECARVLRPDGVLIMSTPERRLASTLYPIRRRPNNPHHVFEYRMKEFLAALHRNFEIEQVCGQGFVPTPLAVWPIQIALKATCYAFRRFGAYGIIDRIYHNEADVEVRDVRDFRGNLPSFVVVSCSPLRELRDRST